MDSEKRIDRVGPTGLELRMRVAATEQRFGITCALCCCVESEQLCDNLVLWCCYA